MSETAGKKKSGKKTAIIIVVILIVLVVLGIGGVSAVSAITKQMSQLGLPVDVEKPMTGDISSTISTSGTVNSGTMITYTTGVSAEVAELNIRQGQMISKGDTILTFDVTSLEEQYDQVSLNARSTELSNQSTIEASNKTISERDKAKKRVDELKGQIETMKKDIESLANSVPEDSTRDELAMSLMAKREQLTMVLEEIQMLIDTNEEENDISVNPLYINKCAERDSLNYSISNLEKLLSEMPNANDTISAVIEAKNMELASLQSELASQEAVVQSAEAGVLTSTQKEQMSIASQLSDMQVQSAATMLEEGKAGIVAEQDGIVTSVAITKGSTTAPGYQLCTIADMKDLRVNVALSKNEIASVKLGQPATVTILGKEYEGTVSYISHLASMNANGGTTIEAEVTIKNPDEGIILGLDAKVVIHTAEVKDAMLVSNLSINVDNTGTFVYAVEENQVVKKYVTTGISDINHTEILDGLDSDTMVVSTVSATITEGMTVIPKTAEDAETNH